MTILTLIGKGMLIGFATAVPIGPVGILCIQQSISKGKRCGIATGLGAATADTIFGTIAIFGVTLVSSFLKPNVNIIQLIGGVVIILFGAHMYFKKHQQKEIEITASTLIHSYMTTLFITLTNPMTILGYMVLITIFSISETSSNIFFSVIVIIGIFLGSTLWFSILTAVSTFAKTKINPNKLTILNKVFGILIAVCGIILIAKKII